MSMKWKKLGQVDRLLEGQGGFSFSKEYEVILTLNQLSDHLTGYEGC